MATAIALLQVATVMTVMRGKEQDAIWYSGMCIMRIKVKRKSGHISEHNWHCEVQAEDRWIEMELDCNLQAQTSGR
ncbi:uncharacterized protein F4822DRAFT_435041 [Hypoxylon trugodes]|uniref:uncharacterized protein n=1 Tax=Hypoxylon trugodes TaxID=326681 RepID=UPI0021908686|nr:uncharacterized protein F4822DRAFT_435041 [Hypoxylon trugodes]KAI1383110.1 hypothetical protein F4822DRAFT_435041 [Hypoxylon trugodes]